MKRCKDCSRFVPDEFGKRGHCTHYMKHSNAVHSVHFETPECSHYFGKDEVADENKRAMEKAREDQLIHFDTDRSARG